MIDSPEAEKERDSGSWPFDSLPDSWEWANFSDVFKDVTSSKRKLPQKSYSKTGEYAVVDQGQDLIGGFTNERDLVHPASPPYVIFGDHTCCVKHIPIRFVQGADGVKVLKITDPIEDRYAFHAMRLVDLPAKGYARHFKFLRHTQFPLAPLNEQRRIVAKLEALQERIQTARETLEAIPPLLERFRQSILAAAFRGDLTADWRARNPDVEPASALLDRIRKERRKKWEEAELVKMNARGKSPNNDRWKEKYKEPEPVDTTNLPELAEGWAWAGLDEITINRDGERIPLKQSDRAERPGLFPYYGASGIIDYIDSYIYEGDFLLIAEDGANLFSRSTPIAFHATGRFWVNNHAHVLHGMDPLVTQALRNYVNGAHLDHLITGTAQPKLTQKNLNRIFLPLAPYDELIQIMSALSAADRATEAIEAQSSDSTRLIEDLEGAILARAFRGELVPQDWNDEPASALLERIRTEREKQPKTARGRRSRRTRTEIPSTGAESGQQAVPLVDEETVAAVADNVASISSIDDYSTEDLLIALRQVLPLENWYDLDETIRAVAQHLGFQRTGSRIREAIQHSIDTATRRKIAYYQRGEIWIASRTIDDYTRDELKQYFLSAIGTTWWDRTDAIRAATRHLGFARTGKNIEAAWKSVINGLIRTGELEASGSEIRRTPK